MKKATVGGKMYDVITQEEYSAHPQLYKAGVSAVELALEDGNNIILPCRSGSTMDKPGVYKKGALHWFIKPDEEEIDDYKPTDVTRFDDVTTIKTYSERCEQVRRMENTMLTNTIAENQFIPNISGKETPEMKALKLAIIEKQIDLDLYAERFGDNYPNDKRQFKGDSVTLFMIKRFCSCLDMKATITIEDKSPDVPNPIGRKISVSLCGDDSTEGDD